MSKNTEERKEVLEDLRKILPTYVDVRTGGEEFRDKMMIYLNTRWPDMEWEEETHYEFHSKNGLCIEVMGGNVGSGLLIEIGHKNIGDLDHYYIYRHEFKKTKDGSDEFDRIRNRRERTTWEEFLIEVDRGLQESIDHLQKMANTLMVDIEAYYKGELDLEN